MEQEAVNWRTNSPVAESGADNKTQTLILTYDPSPAAQYLTRPSYEHFYNAESISEQ